MTLKEAERNYRAYLITQFARYGAVGADEYLETYINEEVLDYLDKDNIYDYYRFLSDHDEEVLFDDLEEMLESSFEDDPVGAARAVFFGNVNWNDDYFRFDAYGNIESLTEGQLLNEMRGNMEFLKWYVEENDLIDWDSEEVKNDIEAANVLLAAGY